MTQEEALLKAGRIAAEARGLAARLAKPGTPLGLLCSSVEAEIRRLGGELAFPVQSSRNEIAAHFCPRPSDPTACILGDLLKIDLGVHIEGWVVDTAVTVAVGGDSRSLALVSAVEAALEAAIAVAGPFVPLGRLSAAIETAVTSRGFRPMRNLCGHHLGRWTVHCPPPVPNFDDGAATLLMPGAVFAIEPFATTGAGIAAEKGHAEVFRFHGDSASLESIDVRLSDALAARNGLPFSMRDLSAVPEREIEEGIAALHLRGALSSYPPLVEMTGHPVAQAEHTLLVTDRAVLVLTA